MMIRPVVLAAVIASLAGCALTTKSPPLAVRYFDPPTTAATEPAPAVTAAAPRLRLGRITASSHLRFRIVERTSNVELHAYDSLRWTDTPEVYARRAIARAVFAGRGIAQVVGGAAPVLEVEVVGFEQSRSLTGPTGRVELRYQLRDDHAVVTAGQIAVERRATTPGIAGVVAAIGVALDAAADELAARIVARLTP